MVLRNYFIFLKQIIIITKNTQYQQSVAYVNMEMGLKNWTPDSANHENRLSDLMDIQMSISELKFRSIDLPVC